MSGRREFVLAALRSAVLRTRLIENELTMIGVSLRHNMIDEEGVMRWLHDEGLMYLIPQFTGAVEQIASSTATSANGAARE